jgi:hypothetical protein
MADKQNQRPATGGDPVPPKRDNPLLKTTKISESERGKTLSNPKTGIDHKPKK